LNLGLQENLTLNANNTLFVVTCYSQHKNKFPSKTKLFGQKKTGPCEAGQRFSRYATD